MNTAGVVGDDMSLAGIQDRDRELSVGGAFVFLEEDRLLVADDLRDANAAVARVPLNTGTTWTTRQTASRTRICAPGAIGSSGTS